MSLYRELACSVGGGSYTVEGWKVEGVQRTGLRGLDEAVLCLYVQYTCTDT